MLGTPAAPGIVAILWATSTQYATEVAERASAPAQGDAARLRAAAAILRRAQLRATAQSS